MTTVLGISPHTDDLELGAGGTIIRHLDAGHTVFHVVCTEAIPVVAGTETPFEECEKAAKWAGISLFSRKHLLGATRNLHQHRQELLDWFLALKQTLNPDLVYIPSSFTTHQDHVTVYEEGFRAFKDRSLHGYEDPWNNRSFSPTRFVELDRGLVGRKVLWLSHYKSQSTREYMRMMSVLSLGKSRALAMGSRNWAEAFEVIREVDRIV